MSTPHSPPIDELHVLIPFWGLAGGVIKVLDYAHHAMLSGIRVTLWAPTLPPPQSAVRSLPVLKSLLADSAVKVAELDQLVIDTAAPQWVLFTEPTHHALVEHAAESHLGPRLIHLVQGTRHATPEWSDGFNYRLLHRPMSRIVVSSQVDDAVRPLVNERYPMRVIVEGHNWEYFSGPRSASGKTERPLHVMYTTWKSDLGDRIAAELAEDDTFSFHAIRSETSWPELRKRYHDADIVLCTPGPEEGFYLPGLEAMAAGCAVVSAFVGGNESYLLDGTNVVRATYDDPASHTAALLSLAAQPDLRDRMVRNGRDTLTHHTLERERADFLGFLHDLSDDVAAHTTLSAP